MNDKNTSIEEQDDELLYAEDTDGKRIPDENLGLLATMPKKLDFKLLGEKHVVEIQFDQVSYEARRRPSAVAQQMSVDAGILDPEENVEAALELDKQILESPDFQLARAEMALAATKRDSKGRLRISIPQFREGLTAQTLATLILGDKEKAETMYARRYVAVVTDAVQDFFGG